MPSSSTVTRVDPTDFDWSAETGPAADVRRVADGAAAEDGSAPLDEAALLSLRHGLRGSTMWTAGRDGFAWRHGEAVDVVVAPDARRRGTGTALAAEATSEPGPLTAWSHGNHPGAAALAGHLGFDRVRDLWVMRRGLEGGFDGLSGFDRLNQRDGLNQRGDDIRAFRVGQDEEAFLALNAEAFAHHPEQGGLTRADLDERMSEAWFDPAGFFVAERDGELVGFHWTKVHDEQPPYGEVYVVGVSPSAQGSGLGKRLTAVGLEHLASLGLSEVILYVEADNAPAVAVYAGLGFTHAPADTHVQYARRA